MKKHSLLVGISIILSLPVSAQPESRKQLTKTHQATINDPFWSPKFELWQKTTARDVLDKFEGKHLTSAEDRKENNVFENFDKIAAGSKGGGGHAGLPWFDGLIYETIRGIGDLLGQHPDKILQARVDSYVERIYAAQQIDRDGS